MSLKEYRRKRDFGKTAEPTAEAPVPRAKAKARRFVIQKHAASRLHYDFRLELDGTLKSWAVPKGVPYAKGERRLAVQVEDHPVAYIAFEGTIPPGEYGGGTVMVWDEGTYEPLDPDPAKTLAAGKLHVILHGKKLRGEWYLVRLRDEAQWLLIKGGEDIKPVSKKQDDTSVRSGKSMAALSKSKQVWHSSASDAGAHQPAGKKPKSLRARLAKTKAATTASASPARRTKAKTSARAATAPIASSSPRPAPSSAAPRPAPAGPPPKFIEPMQALLVDAPAAGAWAYEIKFDGFRALAFAQGKSVHLLSRNNKDLAAKFPEIADAVAALGLDDAIVDGEIVALDAQGRSSFQLLQGLALGERPPLVYYVFDLLQHRGKNLRALPLTERKTRLATLLGKKKCPPVIRFSASLEGEFAALLTHAQSLGLEGLIGKRPDSLYEAGRRSGAWIKLKLLQEQEFVIGGYTPPAGSRKHLGALIVGVYENKKLLCTGKVGTGFNHALLRELHARFKPLAVDACPFANLPEPRSRRYGQAITASVMKTCHWLKPTLVAQLRFTEWTQDGRLRHPVFLGLREDKAATAVVREKVR